MSAPGMPAGRPRVLQGMSARSNPLAPGPNPVRADELRGPDEAATAQRLHCADRPGCLATAARSSWPAFDCSACGAYRPMPVAQWRLEVPDLAALGCALIRGARSGSLATARSPRGDTPQPFRAPASGRRADTTTPEDTTMPDPSKAPAAPYVPAPAGSPMRPDPRSAPWQPDRPATRPAPTGPTVPIGPSSLPTIPSSVPPPMPSRVPLAPRVPTTPPVRQPR